ncbi:MAG: ketoacyl-ACP synthase III [Alphaproteobacteria bacterium]|nr:ketoacyl-ACP synthase III [Rickettsiales bacterium]
MFVSKIVHVSGFLPKAILTNGELAKTVETSNEWILTRTGIEARHIASEKETTSTMATLSAVKLIKETNLNPEEIDMIIVATTTPDLSFPSVACMVQGNIKATKAFSFDISAACSGFLYGLSIADNAIKSGNAKKVIVIGAEKMSSLVDWSDRATCILFGDGAGAALVEREEIKKGQSQTEKSRIIGIKLLSNGTDIDILKTSGGVSTTAKAGVITMKGQEVFKNAITKMTSSAKDLLIETGITVDQIDLVIPHQANKRILDSTVSNLNIPKSKLMSCINQHGNTSAASIPLAMSLAIQQNKINKGKIILLQCIGAGLTWGSCLIKW